MFGFVCVCVHVRDSHPGETRRQRGLKKKNPHGAISRSAGDALSTSVKAKAGARVEEVRISTFVSPGVEVGGGTLLPC